MKKFSLSLKFTVGLLALLIVAAIGSALVLNPTIKKSVLQSDYKALGKKERLVTEVINEDEESILDYIRDIESLAPLFTDPDSFLSYLNEYEENFGLYSIGILEKSGTPLYSTTNSTYYHESEQKAINQAKLNKNSVVKTVTDTDLYFTGAGSLSWMGDSYIIVIQKELSSNEYLENLGKETDTSLTLFIGDMRAGTNNKDANGNYLSGKFTNQEVLDTVYTRGETFEGEVNVEGNEFLAIYRPYVTDNASEKVMFFVGTDIEHVNEISGEITNHVVIAVAICLVLVTILVIIMIFIIVIRPVKAMHKTFKDIVKEDGSIDFTQRIKIHTNDEIGQMEQIVSDFLDVQADFIRNVKETSALLGNSSSDLAANAHETAGATTQITANIASVQNSVVKQNDALTSVHTVLDSNIDEIQILEKLISAQSAGIVESSASIEEMVGNISSVSKSISKMSNEYSELMSITNNAKTRQDTVYSFVQKMAEQSTQLVDANNVISQIASQTNLLAMNAAIEAAHAGDSGKGFSVVADEIRKLAENSSEQSKVIKAELDSISDVIEEVVNSTDLSRKEFEEITTKVSSTNTLVHEISNAMSEQEEASKQVLIALRDMNDSTSNVSSTSKQMTEHGLILKSESEKLEHIAHTVQGSMEEMNAGIKEISTATVAVSDLCTTTRDEILEIENMMKKFII